jgi:nucleotide-binding universal stress UspA family protein
MGRIVVGVDGSEGSASALRWAIAEAQLRGAAVDVVHAWLYPYVGEASFTIGEEEFEAEAQAVLDRSVSQGGPVPSGVVVNPILVHGPAAGALIDAAAGADLLVLSSRGHGGFVGLLLGSVTQQCAHHAPCPLVIVPHPKS